MKSGLLAKANGKLGERILIAPDWFPKKDPPLSLTGDFKILHGQTIVTRNALKCRLSSGWGLAQHADGITLHVQKLRASA